MDLKKIRALAGIEDAPVSEARFASYDDYLKTWNLKSGPDKEIEYLFLELGQLWKDGKFKAAIAAIDGRIKDMEKSGKEGLPGSLDMRKKHLAALVDMNDLIKKHSFFFNG